MSAARSSRSPCTMVGALVVDTGGRIFVQRRTSSRRLFPQCWDIVGGSREAGETVQDALAREIREETGWELESVVAHVLEESWTAEQTAHHEYVFVVTVSGDLSRPRLEPGKHDDFAWLAQQDLHLLDVNRDLGAGDYIERAVRAGLEHLDRNGSPPVRRSAGAATASPGDGPRVAMVGFAGQQGREYYPVLRSIGTVVAGCDVAPGARDLAREWGLDWFPDVESLSSEADFDVAVVTVPHSAHMQVCRSLLRAGKHVVKEKPFAVSEDEAKSLLALSSLHDVSIYTMTQRSFDPLFEFAVDRISRVGVPYWFSYDYHMNLAEPTTGWRALGDQALGGVMLDMGYHAIDVINHAFPLPETARASFLHCHAETREENLEDLAAIHLSFPGRETGGDLRISRHSFAKDERLVVFGSEGVVTVEPRLRRATRYHAGGELREEISAPKDKPEIVSTMLQNYLDHLDDREFRSCQMERHLDNVRVCDLIYESARESLEPHDGAVRFPFDPDTLLRTTEHAS